MLKYYLAGDCNIIQLASMATLGEIPLALDVGGAVGLGGRFAATEYTLLPFHETWAFLAADAARLSGSGRARVKCCRSQLARL